MMMQPRSLSTYLLFAFTLAVVILSTNDLPFTTGQAAEDTPASSREMVFYVDESYEPRPGYNRTFSVQLDLRASRMAETVQISARLTDEVGGALAGKSIALFFEGMPIMVVTDGDGRFATRMLASPESYRVSAYTTGRTVERTTSTLLVQSDSKSVDTAKDMPFIVSPIAFWMMAAAGTVGPTLIRLAYRTGRTGLQQMLLSNFLTLRTYAAPALWSVLMFYSGFGLYLHVQSFTLASNYWDAYWIVFYAIMVTLSIKHIHKYL